MASVVSRLGIAASLALLLGFSSLGCSERGMADPISEAESVSSTRVVIGMEGGVVQLGDEVYLEVPAGALEEDTEISIHRLPERTKLTPVYRFGPEGLIFRLFPRSSG